PPKKNFPITQNLSKIQQHYYIITFKQNSNLKTFNHNPTNNNFTPITPQPNTQTKYLNPQFLSY
ncbi:hypothetical protein, partial [Klebsiella pneumoniae]